MGKIKKNESAISSANTNWFGRDNSFNFYKIDLENQIRIRKVIEILSNEIRHKGFNPKILDLGCGDGEISQKILKLGFDVYGIDLISSIAKKAKKKGIKVSVGDISGYFPFRDDYFDIVFAGEIIEHLFDTKKFLSETCRVLKKGGIFLVTTPNLAHLPDRLRLLKGESPGQITPIHNFLHLHIRHFTFFSLKRYLEMFNFYVEKFISTTVVFSRKNTDIVDKHSIFLAKLFPSLGCSVIIKSRKS